MKHYFRAFVNYMQNDWIKWFCDVEFAINNVFSIIIFASLFLINSSQNSRLEFEFFEFLITNIIVQQRIKLIDVENFIKKMKNLIVYFKEKMLITQIIYEFNVNRFRRFCFWYLVENEIWLNVKNLNIARSIVKLNDRHVKNFKIKRVFKNSLVIELNFLEFMKIHCVFHVILFNYVINDFLFDQRQKSRELVFVENDERAWYVIKISNFKIDNRYNSSLLKYYIEWENDFSIWEFFYFINNCRQTFEKYHVEYFVVAKSYVTLCIIDNCQCHEYFIVV